MQEHPVPQNVTGYEFHLIGQMTLKQFLEVAVGVVVAVVINATNLPSFVKVPLMIIAGLSGAALAFIPLEGRPLDRWFFAFVKSIYQPTMFFWKKSAPIPEAFTYTQPKTVDTTTQVDYAPLRQARVSEYVQTVAPAQKDTVVDETETLMVQNILSLFDTDSSEQTPPSPPPAPMAPSVAPQITPAQTQRGFIQTLFIQTPEQTTATAQQTTPPHEETILPSPKGVIEQQTVFGYEKKDGVDTHTAEPTPVPIYDTSEVVMPLVPPKHEQKPLHPTVFLHDTPFPNPPTTPNIIAGQVLAGNQVVADAIITIAKSSDSSPVRALKTNALGRFATVTPLENGSYVITAEKDGYLFDNYSLVVDNQVVPPLSIASSTTT